MLVPMQSVSLFNKVEILEYMRNIFNYKSDVIKLSYHFKFGQFQTSNVNIKKIPT